MYTIVSRIVKVVIGIALLAMIAGRVNAQGLVTERSLSMGMAKTIAEAAQAECRAKGYHTTVAVVDRAGQLLILCATKRRRRTRLRWLDARLTRLGCFAPLRRNFRKRQGRILRRPDSATSPICWR